jgi:hypothetical protein
MTLTAVSDGLLVATIAGYLVAMVCHAVELATRQGVPAGVPGTGTVAVAGGDDGPGRWAGPVAVGVTVAAVTQGGSVLAGYLHARPTAGWRGRPAALIAMVAWGTMLVNLFVVNLVFTGLHSYAGL